MDHDYLVYVYSRALSSDAIEVSDKAIELAFEHLNDESIGFFMGRCAYHGKRPKKCLRLTEEKLTDDQLSWFFSNLTGDFISEENLETFKV